MILVYFKEPPISLVFEGDLGKDTMKALDHAGLAPMIQLTDPDGHRQVLFPRRDLDITYMKEITLEEWEEMKAKKEEADKQRKAQGAGGRITPASFMKPIPGRGKGPGGGN